MNFTKEQIDYIKKAVDHVDFLTGGSRNNKTKQIIEELQQENARLKEIENKLNFIKNRAKQGMSQENINKCAIELVNNYLKEN